METTTNITNPDAAILDAMQRIRAARIDIHGKRQVPVPEATTFWNKIEADEQTICQTLAKTPKGVATQIWASLSHSLPNRAHNAAADRGNLAYFTAEVERDLDWSDCLLLTALRSLAAMEA